MEKTIEKRRELKVNFAKGGSGSVSPKLNIPKKFLDVLEVTTETRDVIVELDEENKRIIITKK